MNHDRRLWRASRRVFGALKRPVWLVVHELTGRRVQSTAEYFDFAWFGGLFEASLAGVNRRLPPGFRAIEARSGRAELEVFCATYRSIDVLRPYREMTVAVPVELLRERSSAIDGEYVLHMLVTSEEARWSGADNYGFPKVLADVAIDEQPSKILCTTRQAGRHVLTLEVEPGATAAFTEIERLLNVRDDGQVTLAYFDMVGDGLEGNAPGGVRLKLGEHAISDQLRDMGLDTRHGRILYVPRARGVLGRAQLLGKLVQPKPTGALLEIVT